MKMSKREYFRENKKVLQLLFKLIGVVATSVFAFLFLVTAFRFSGVMDAFYLFLVCFVLGNLIAASFTYFYFSVQYQPYKDQLDVFSSLDEEVKSEFKIVLYANEPAHRFSLTKVTLYANYSDRFFEIRPDRSEKKIRVVLFENLEHIDFSQAYDFINQKYKADSINLIGSGLVKIIAVPDWKKMNSIEFKSVFQELYRISTEENLGETMPNRNNE